MNTLNKELEYLADSLEIVTWYNGYDIILEAILKGLEDLEAGRKSKYDGYCYDYYNIVKDHNTEEYYATQFIWMILVDKFGNYGTSPRFGWIEDIEGCKEFLRYILEQHKQDDEE